MAKDTAWLKAWLDFSTAYNTASCMRDDEDNVNSSPKKENSSLVRIRSRRSTCLLTWASQLMHKIAAAFVLFPAHGNSTAIGILWEECNIALHVYTLHSYCSLLIWILNPFQSVVLKNCDFDHRIWWDWNKNQYTYIYIFDFCVLNFQVTVESCFLY